MNYMMLLILTGLTTSFIFVVKRLSSYAVKYGQ